MKQAALAGVGAVPPSRDGLSHANKVRPAEFIETFFWRVLERLQTLDPSIAIVDTAGEHENKRARHRLTASAILKPAKPSCGGPTKEGKLCAGIAAGEIVVFDKEYVDFDHLADLDARGVWWVTRAKDNMSFRVRRNLVKDEGKIVRDQMVQIDGSKVVRRVLLSGYGTAVKKIHRANIALTCDIVSTGMDDE